MTTTTPSSQPRDADGRFVKRRRSRSATTKSGHDSGESRTVGLGQIATLTFAIILGVAGFAFAVFWIGALVLMGILWGTMAAEHQRQQAGRRKGVLAEVVGVVVDQAKDVAESARDATSDGTGK
jgi:hypothetical protein